MWCELQLLFDDGRPEHRVVGFDNIVMWRGRLHYIYAGEIVSHKLLSVNQMLSDEVLCVSGAAVLQLVLHVL